MVVVNQGGTIVLLNVQAEKQFGYHRDELLGQPVKNLIPNGFAERLVADGLRSPADALAQQIGTGIELIGRRKDGSAFPIELMLSPLESAKGILVTAAIRDITARKTADQHLAQMEGRYRGLLEAAPDAMVVVNQRGDIVLLNVQAEKQFGYHRDELLGQPVKNLIPEGFAERLIADDLRSAEEALGQQIGTGIELTARRKNGSTFPIELMLSPLDRTGASSRRSSPAGGCGRPWSTVEWPRSERWISPTTCDSPSLWSSSTIRCRRWTASRSSGGSGKAPPSPASRS
jgi:PAS domain S-box-containing protein